MHPFTWDFRGRTSTRIKGYNYSLPGSYYVTINTQGKACLFGKIQDERMILSPSGIMVLECWLSLIRHYPLVDLDTFVVMPNHFHGMINIQDRNEIDLNRSVTSRVLADDIFDGHPHWNEIIRWIRNRGEHKVRPYDTTNAVPHKTVCRQNIDYSIYPSQIADNEYEGRGEPCVRPEQPPRLDIRKYSAGTSPDSLGRIIQEFKSRTTHEYINGVKQEGWKPFNKRLWQRSYWDSIIWTERDLAHVREYINDNPRNWMRDSEYQKPDA